jgi:hypothetical protein
MLCFVCFLLLFRLLLLVGYWGLLSNFNSLMFSDLFSASAGMAVGLFIPVRHGAQLSNAGVPFRHELGPS